MAAYPLDENRIQQIDNALSTSFDQLQNIRTSFSKPNHNVSTVSELTKLLTSEFGLENPKDLSGLLLFLQGVHVRNSIALDEVVSSIEEGFRDWDLPKELLKNWANKRDTIRDIASSPVVKYVSKKTELYYRYSYHIHDFRIISELRPVMDEDRKSISEFILFNRLHLTYSNPAEREAYLELPIGLDELRRLQAEIEVALSKANVIQQELSKSIGRSTTPYTKRQRP